MRPAEGGPSHVTHALYGENFFPHNIGGSLRDLYRIDSLLCQAITYNLSAVGVCQGVSDGCIVLL